MNLNFKVENINFKDLNTNQSHNLSCEFMLFLSNTEFHGEVLLIETLSISLKSLDNFIIRKSNEAIIDFVDWGWILKLIKNDDEIKAVIKYKDLIYEEALGEQDLKEILEEIKRIILILKANSNFLPDSTDKFIEKDLKLVEELLNKV